MNKRDKSVIDVIGRVLDVPLPASGSQSASVRGVAGYAHDMTELVPPARQLITILKTGESYRWQIRDMVADLNIRVNRVLGHIQ